MLNPLVLAAAFFARTPAAPAVPIEVDPAAAESLLIRTGITPGALAAAGCSAEQTDAIVSAMLLFTARPGALESIAAATSASNSSSPATAVEGRAQLTDLLDEAFDLATLSIANTGHHVLLVRVADNAQRFPEIPTRYLVIAERTPRQWLQLRGALAAQRFATSRNTTLAPTPAAVLAEANDEPLTLAASEATALALNSITAAYRARLGQ